MMGKRRSDLPQFLMHSGKNTLNQKNWRDSSNTVWAVVVIAIVVISAVSISCGYAINLALKDEQEKQRLWPVLGQH